MNDATEPNNRSKLGTILREPVFYLGFIGVAAYVVALFLVETPYFDAMETVGDFALGAVFATYAIRGRTWKNGDELTTRARILDGAIAVLWFVNALFL